MFFNLKSRYLRDSIETNPFDKHPRNLYVALNNYYIICWHTQSKRGHNKTLNKEVFFLNKKKTSPDVTLRRIKLGIA